jgi:hypothetical protein
MVDAILTTALLIFGAVSGLLMLVSPERYAAFIRWTSRSESYAPQAQMGRQAQFRSAGLIILVVCV